MMANALCTIAIIIRLHLVSGNKEFRLFLYLFLIVTVNLNLLRLDQLCKDQGKKVPLRLSNTVSTFSLYSREIDLQSQSLECHIEVSTQQPNSGKIQFCWVNK